jgi:hypothetical protein
VNSGIDQRPEEIGRAAIRILTALIAERSFGPRPVIRFSNPRNFPDPGKFQGLETKTAEIRRPPPHFNAIR